MTADESVLVGEGAYCVSCAFFIIHLPRLVWQLTRSPETNGLH